MCQWPKVDRKIIIVTNFSVILNWFQDLVQIMKYFYSHLIEVENLTVELDGLELSDSEKKHLAGLADDTFHTAILDAILSKLPENQRRQLLEHVGLEKHDKVWQILNEHINEVESL